MADAIAIISKPIFEKLAAGTPALGVEYGITRYDSIHKGLDTLADGGALFLVTVRPGDALWLVQALRVLTKDATGWQAVSHQCATVDLTSVKHLLDLTRDVGEGKLAMSLQTPRALTPHDALLFTHAATEAANHRGRKPIYTVKLPRWLLDEATKAGAPAKATKPAKAKPAPAKPAKPPAAARPAKLSDLLIEGAISLIEETAGTVPVAKLLAEPKRKNGLRGLFTESVQTFFDASDPKEARRLLRDELAPFVDGPALALALAEVGDDLHTDLVDQFACKALDDLARALVALASDRPDAVPATCAPFRDALAQHVDQVKALLEDA
jgi:hypothetical protein